VTGLVVEEAEVGEYAGFTLTGDGLFLLGDFTVTHNSLIYVAAAILGGFRTLFLTSSKGLQSQLMNDFRDIGMVDVRGRNNYRCKLAADGSTCDHGPCIAGIPCPYKIDSSCAYYRAIRIASRSNLVVTNYSFWMASIEYASHPLLDFDLIVCDEGHGLPDVASDWLTVELDKSDKYVMRIAPDWSIVGRFNITHWSEWARDKLPEIGGIVDDLASSIAGAGTHDSPLRRDYTRAKSLQNSLFKIAHANDDWIVDAGDHTVNFAPIWPAPYMESTVWHQTKRILLTSATIVPKTISMLGIDAADCLYTEYPHSFPVCNRQLVHIPTVQMNFRNEKSPDHMRAWISRIDQIVGQRQDRKGLIHTVSYGRRDALLRSSHYSGSMLTHKRLDTEHMVQTFKHASPPAILVSPSMTTGYDFPGDECRYQIIGKLAYPDTRNRIAAARSKDDPEYSPYIAMQQLVQAVGRGVRSADDWCESFIIDDNIKWFMRQHGKHFSPQWFRDALVWARWVPAPRSID
jgi:Rad3-related DNA helicase